MRGENISTRRAGRSRKSSPARSAVSFQAEGQPDVENALEDGVEADHPYQSKRARARRKENTDPEQHRNDTAQDQKPFVLDLLPQPNCADDLENTDGDRPSGNEEKKNQGRYAGPGEGQDTGRDPEEPNYCEPPAWGGRAADDSGYEREQAVDERVHAVHHHKRAQGQSRLDECQHTKTDSNNAAQ